MAAIVQSMHVGRLKFTCLVESSILCVTIHYLTYGDRASVTVDAAITEHVVGVKVRCLMDRGADVEHEDISGIRPLDRAISCHHIDVVNCFLRRGAKIGN